MSIFDLLKKDQRKSIYYRNHFATLNNILPYFRSANNMEKADAVVLWADFQGPSRERALNAKRLGKPLIIVQPGKYSVREYVPPVSFELLADKICVWGPRDYDLLVNNGIDKSRVVLTGAPIFNKVERTRGKTNGRSVVFAPHHWDMEMEENHQVYNELAKIKDIDLTVKLLKKLHDPKKYGEKVIVSALNDPNLLNDIFKLLRKTDIVISNTSSTFELIAMYLNIPVIYFDNFKPRPFLDVSAEVMAKRKELEPPPRGVDYTKNIHDIPDLIKLNLEKPDRLKQEREKELYDCASIGLLSSPAENIRNVILSAIDGNLELKIN